MDRAIGCVARSVGDAALGLWRRAELERRRVVRHATKTGTDSDVPQFGDLASPCGPGSPSGTPDQAVDASTVTIGYGDDAGYTGSPGIGHEASDAVKAMIDWCNQQGGINGRTVVGKYYDAKITETANVMAEACTQTFMLVGQYFALPEGAEQTRIECELPTVPGVVSGGALAMAPLAVASYPQPIDYYNVGAAAQIAQAFPDGVKKAATMLPIFPNITDYGQRFVRTVPSVGWNFIGCDQTYPITGVSDYRPYVQKLKDCGAEVVFTLDLQTNMKNILDAAKQLDYSPVWLNARLRRTPPTWPPRTPTATATTSTSATRSCPSTTRPRAAPTRPTSRS